VSRVLLINPPSPFSAASPPLGLSYLAASLLEGGHEVQVCDLAARFPPSREDLVGLLEAWRPALVGVTLYTEVALATYDLVATLPRGEALWVAGGVHATAQPAEPLRFGFAVTVRGEGALTLRELADLLDRGTSGPDLLPAVPGLSWRDSSGELRATADRPRLQDLDALPPPHRAGALFPRRWYLPDGVGSLAVSLLTSRGCAGRCTFCSNEVTGRQPRLHSPARVLAELLALRQREGQVTCSFHDDAFTADRPRLLQLCRLFREQLTPRPVWWCESRVDGFDAEIAGPMREAGCRAVAFGVESGDPGVLRRIGKQITPEQVLAAFAAARGAGLLTHANIMFGFPGETEEELGQTLRLMERLAPHTTSFGALGLLVPYPGTAIYRRHAVEYGFTEWWLDRPRVSRLNRPFLELEQGLTTAEQWPALQQQLETALLDVDFFRYPDGVRRRIEEGLAFRRGYRP